MAMIGKTLNLQATAVRQLFDVMNDKQRRDDERNTPCEECGSNTTMHNEFGKMLLCDAIVGGGGRCNKGWHLGCLDPPIDEDDEPLGRWFCPEHASH